MSAVARARAVLAGLGGFSPLATLATFAPGPRRLLADAERNGERAVHVVRLLYWASLLLGFGLVVGLSREILLLAAVLGGLFWALVWRVLSGPQHYRWLRYVLIATDPWLGLDTVALASGALPEQADYLRLMFGIEMSGLDTSALIPPVLVFVALSGALRLDPRVAIVGALSSVSAYVVYLRLVPLDPGIALFFGLLIALSGIVGANAARVLRYVVLRASEGALIGEYVPQSLRQEVARSGHIEQGGRVAAVTLVLCDIRGFTQISEQFGAAETVAFVNRYLDVACPPILAAGGVIDKFMGDGVLAFFEGVGNESRALGAARAILDAVSRSDLGHSGVRIGVALHSGDVLLGSIGPKGRREYTVISDVVNVVARLEELNKTFGSVIVASEATLAAVPAEMRAGFVGPSEVTVRGRSAPLGVHHLPRSG